MTISDLAAGTPLDAARPWPGLDAFSEALQSYFFGREAEAEELFRRIRRDTVTVLFGQSGLGKTSLLQAGLFPRLRDAEFLPVLVRLDYAENAPSPTAQVKAMIEREAAAVGAEMTPIGADEGLWSYFHRVDTRLTGRDGRPLVPVLAFDQFEEMFTLGLAREGGRAASQSFLGELAELIENRPPETFEQAIENDPAVIEKYRFDRQDYRILIALREDFLAQLESLRARAPLIGRNRFRLRWMTGRQGLDAVTRPLPGLIDDESAREIVRFVGRANPEDAFGLGEDGDGLEVVPALLSLVCRELNERRLELGLDRITPDLLAGNRDSIIRSFYETALADQPVALREFVEDRLLSDSGFRESVTLDGARRVLGASGVAPDALDVVMRRRLLRFEERLDVTRVEIIHDVLIPTIRDSRDSRHLRQAQAAAAAREAELRRASRRTRLAYGMVAMMAALLVTVGVVGWWGWQSSQRAERNAFAAVETADFVVKNVAERLRPLAGVQTKTVRDILGDTERAFDQLAAVVGGSAEVRWRRAEMLIDFVSVYHDLGDNPEALNRARSAQQIMEALIKEDPRNEQWQLSLAKSHLAVGDVLCEGTGGCFNNMPDALVEYRAGFAIIELQVKAHPTEAILQDVFARAYSRIGQVLKAQNKPGEALVMFRADLAISEKLVQTDPNNAQWAHGLAVSHEKIGDVLLAQGDVQQAFGDYQSMHDILQALAQRDPGNTDWQRDLAIAVEHMGAVKRDTGDVVQALALYRQGLAIRKRLVEKDPANTVWQNDLSNSDERIADVLMSMGDLSAVLALYRENLTIRQAIAQKDPDSAFAQYNLFVAYTRLGIAFTQRGDLPPARDAYGQAAAILLRLKETNSTFIRGGTEVAWLEDRLIGVSWSFLIADQPQDALDTAESALKLDPTNLAASINRAHALLLLGKFDDAKAIYIADKDKVLDGKPAAQIIRDDFAAFRKAGIDTPDMKRIDALLGT